MTVTTFHPIPRTLSRRTDAGEDERLTEADVAALEGCVVILGEPGLGKTRFLEALAERHGWPLRRASQFAQDPSPGRHTASGGAMLIDALDEMAALRSNDPLDSVLAKLIEAQLPRCFIACRAAEWRDTAYQHEIKQEYGRRLSVLTLNPFDRDDALEFLQRLGVEEAGAVLDQLDRTHAEELYGNPLTLQLLADACRASGAPPETRAELFRAACDVMWEEQGQDPLRAQSPLAGLDRATALDSAGAVCASLILAGADAVSRGPTLAGGGLLRISEIAALPGAGQAEAVLSSRLFVKAKGADGAVRPVHRMVAEYLGARWLARQALTPLLGSQILALLQVDGGVPSSLRGLHAWLAHHSPRLAEPVIDADPYGLLRYGDADGLDLVGARMLLAALKRLHCQDPYFRSEDWGSSAGRALGQATLVRELRDALATSDASHLRSLVLDSLPGTPASRELAPELEAIVTEPAGGYSFAERLSAAEALFASGADQPDWVSIARDLIALGSETSTRLAIHIKRLTSFEHFTADDIASAALAHVGLLSGSPSTSERSTASAISVLAGIVPESQVAPVLDSTFRLRDSQAINDNANWSSAGWLATFVTRLIKRALDASELCAEDLLRWLSIAPIGSGYGQNDFDAVSRYLAENTILRRGVQSLALFDAGEQDGGEWALFQLIDQCAALFPTEDDVIFHLEALAGRGPLSPQEDRAWRHLLSFASSRQERCEDIFAAAELSVDGDAERAALLQSYRNPEPPRWRIQQNRRRAEQEAHAANERQSRVADFSKHRDEMRRGEFQHLYRPACAYFALVWISELSIGASDGPGAPERIGHWLNADLQAAACEGFEQILHRDDNPSLKEATDAIATDQILCATYPIAAGLAERLRTGRSIDDITPEVAAATFLTIQKEGLNTDALKQAVKALLRRTPDLYETVWRAIIEPGLKAKSEHSNGLHELGNDPEDQALAERLACEWLMRFPRLKAGPEAELMDIVLSGRDPSVFKPVWRERAERKSIRAERRNPWRAVGLIVDFETAAPLMPKATRANRDLLWHIKQRAGWDALSRRVGPALTPTLTGWIISYFRRAWPYTERPAGLTTGASNPWDATQLLIGLANELAGNTEDAARDELARLAAEPADAYTPHIRHAAAQQASLARSERQLTVQPDELGAVLKGEPPRTTRDLLPIVLHALCEVQARLRGAHTDPVNNFWCQDGEPRGEDWCTDRLIELLEPHLGPYGIGLHSQADMPQGKRSDFICTISADVSLPVEAKGQWNRDLWQSAEDQLNAFYAINHASGGLGLFLVYWFGACGKPLKNPPHVVATPQTPHQLESTLRASLPPALRDTVTIHVLDCTRPN